MYIGNPIGRRPVTLQTLKVGLGNVHQEIHREAAGDIVDPKGGSWECTLGTPLCRPKGVDLVARL